MTERTCALIAVADLGPGVMRLLYQSRHGATDPEVRHAVEAVETA